MTRGGSRGGGRPPSNKPPRVPISVLVVGSFKDAVRDHLEPGETLMQFCIDAMQKELLLRKQRKHKEQA